MTDQPQPGDVWERDGEQREVGRVTKPKNERRGAFVLWFEPYNFDSDGSTRLDEWMEWQSGATLVERKEPAQ